MTEQGKPLSRRDRRAMEARAAATKSDATESMESAGDDPAPPTDGLSRRDRRRIERSQQPMETWTAEEEMIATGQLPAMTPEVIAQQEQIAKRKAADAAADAAAAAAALGLADGDDAPQAPVEVDESTPPVRESAFGRVAEADTTREDDVRNDDVRNDDVRNDSEVLQDVGPDIDELPDVESDDAESMSTEPETVAEPEPEPEPEPESEAEAEAEPFAGSEPQPAAHSETDADVVEEPDAAPDAKFVAEAVAEDGEPDLAPDQPLPGDDDGIPAAFRGMFPPGSLQARAMAARREEAAQAAAGPSASEAHQPQGDSLEEFRRLTAEAMAGIEGSGARVVDQAAPTDSQPEWGEPTEQAGDDSGADAEVGDSGDGDVATGDGVNVLADDVATEQNPWRAAPVVAALDTENTADLADDQSVDEPETDVPAADVDESSDSQSLDAEPKQMPPQASFDDLIAAPDDEVPLAEMTVDPDAPLPKSDEVNPAVAPSIWDSHPLNDTNATARELADAPSQAIPQPDFSKLAPATNPEHPAPFSPTAYSSGEPPLTTGSIEVARRKVPELHPAGGARHFRWAHIAVIGAIAFVLGVLVWNLAGQG